MVTCKTIITHYSTQKGGRPRGPTHRMEEERHRNNESTNAWGKAKEPHPFQEETKDGGEPRFMKRPENAVPGRIG